jgi:hypothetical protein
MKKVIIIILVLSLFSWIPVVSAGDNKMPGKPFEALQQQLDVINSKLDTIIEHECPSQIVTYTMDCSRSVTNPFIASQNYELEFSSELIGSFITAIAVEISLEADELAYIELKDALSGVVVATSDNASTATLGWIEFLFASKYEIDGSRLLVNFVTFGNARIFNCVDTVDFTPTGMTATGPEYEFARSYVTILK